LRQAAYESKQGVVACVMAVLWLCDGCVMYDCGIDDCVATLCRLCGWISLTLTPTPTLTITLTLTLTLTPTLTLTLTPTLAPGRKRGEAGSGGHSQHW
jgi:hypothetical protein